MDCFRRKAYRQTKESAKTPLDFSSRLLHLIIKTLYSESNFSKQSWTTKAFLDIDWLRAIEVDNEVVRLSMTCQRFGKAPTILPKEVPALRDPSKSQEIQTSRAEVYPNSRADIVFERGRGALGDKALRLAASA